MFSFDALCGFPVTGDFVPDGWSLCFVHDSGVLNAHLIFFWWPTLKVRHFKQLVCISNEIFIMSCSPVYIR